LYRLFKPNKVQKIKIKNLVWPILSLCMTTSSFLVNVLYDFSHSFCHTLRILFLIVRLMSEIKYTLHRMASADVMAYLQVYPLFRLQLYQCGLVLLLLLLLLKRKHNGYPVDCKYTARNTTRRRGVRNNIIISITYI